MVSPCARLFKEGRSGHTQQHHGLPTTTFTHETQGIKLRSMHLLAATASTQKTKGSSRLQLTVDMYAPAQHES